MRWSSGSREIAKLRCLSVKLHNFFPFPFAMAEALLLHGGCRPPAAASAATGCKHRRLPGKKKKKKKSRLVLLKETVPSIYTDHDIVDPPLPPVLGKSPRRTSLAPTACAAARGRLPTDSGERRAFPFAGGVWADKMAKRGGGEGRRRQRLPPRRGGRGGRPGGGGGHGAAVLCSAPAGLAGSGGYRGCGPGRWRCFPAQGPALRALPARPAPPVDGTAAGPAPGGLTGPRRHFMAGGGGWGGVVVAGGASCGVPAPRCGPIWAARGSHECLQPGFHFAFLGMGVIPDADSAEERCIPAS